MSKITESSSLYAHLDQMSTAELVQSINQEDQKVALAVREAAPQIERLIDAAFEKMQAGGRLFYIGAGTSGRLGVLDASECPPTFGVDFDRVIGLIAGGDRAIRKAVENAEDDSEQAWIDLQEFQISSQDVLIGIAASGSTPYVVGGLSKAREEGIITGSISCNPASKIAEIAEFPIEVIVGPEFVTGSTRMKSGTAQKLVLNTLSTTLMIKLGHVKGNKMVDMKLSNQKLQDRAVRMLSEEAEIPVDDAKQFIEKLGSVRQALEYIKNAQKKGI